MRSPTILSFGDRHLVLLWFLRVSLLAALLSSCSGLQTKTSDPEATPGKRADAPTIEVLRVGTSGDYPPFSRAGKGFDVEVAKLLAEDLGAQLEFVPFRWPELLGDVQADRFDIAMGGITWRPNREVVGRMSRAYAVGGPCIVSSWPLATKDRSFPRVAVNRGGILERWARATLTASSISTTDDNLSLPSLLEAGDVDAFVTDSFEVQHFREQGQHVDCDPATDRKVYWIAPGRTDLLGSYLDSWIRDNEARLRTLRQEYFGAPLPRDDIDHAVDLLARRLAFMPAVASFKRQREIAIEDKEREATVLAGASKAAAKHRLDPSPVRNLFALQIELAKNIQRRAPGDEAATLDLQSQIRPTLITLGDRILEAIAGAAEQLSGLDRSKLDVLEPQLEEPEIKQLLELLVDSDWPAPEL